jgi:hypothetical protein
MLARSRRWNSPSKVMSSSVNSRRRNAICSSRRVVPGGHPEPQPPAGHEVDVGRLPGDEHGLALREDQDPRHELDLAGRRGEEREGRERVVERVALGVGTPDLGERTVTRADDVVVDHQVPVAELLRRDGEPAQGERVAPELDLRADDADPHEAGLWL